MVEDSVAMSIYRIEDFYAENLITKPTYYL